MKRDPKEMEALVLEHARKVEDSDGWWSAPLIQFSAFPGLGVYRSKELGISAAIQRLIRQGKVRRVERGMYKLTEPHQGAGGGDA
ncbi:MAG: hypothetical protein Q7Q73_05790 [Verrucomicrobiota bacterium JB024]|nr:hypothetical protein [Verrucomicrobiota bacterium JB024]